MTINDALPLKAARRDAIANLKFLRLWIWAADKPYAISFTVDSLWSATLINAT